MLANASEKKTIGSAALRYCLEDTMGTPVGRLRGRSARRPKAAPCLEPGSCRKAARCHRAKVLTLDKGEFSLRLGQIQLPQWQPYRRTFQKLQEFSVRK